MATSTRIDGAPMTGLLGAIQFLTRLPVRLASPPRPADTVPWYPVVGALIGLIVGGLAAGLAELVPTAVAAAVAVLAGVLLTGALHEDGLADVADAFAGGRTRDDRLRILSDPVHGSYGVAALSGSIVLRIACVASLSPAAAVAGAVAAHALARAVMVATVAIVRPATDRGLGAETATAIDRRRVPYGVAAGAALAAAATGWWVVPIAGAAVAAAAAVAALAVRRLDGITGDVLGAVEQVGECAALVVLSGLAAHHGVWWS
jgi:adenosylcobinamide-GDP ribazoletransferase